MFLNLLNGTETPTVQGAGGSSDSMQPNSFAGAAGGKAVNLNGNTVTWVATGTRYGAIS